MTKRTETELALDRYLAEGPVILPDRVLEAALDEIDITPQRHGWRLPWRFTPMPTFQKFAVAGLALIALVVVGSLSLRPTPVVVGTQSPGVPQASPASTAGTVRLELESDRGNIPVRFELPAGWYLFEQENISAFLPEADDSYWPLVGVDVLLVDDVYADTCDGGAFADPGVGPSVDDLVAWLREQPNLIVGDAESVRVAGYDGIQVEVTSARRSGCTEPSIWPAGLPLGSHRNGPYLIRLSMEYRLILLDVDGRRVVLVVNGMRGPFESRVDQAQAVLDSLAFE